MFLATLHQASLGALVPASLASLTAALLNLPQSAHWGEGQGGGGEGNITKFQSHWSNAKMASFQLLVFHNSQSGTVSESVIIANTCFVL